MLLNVLSTLSRCFSRVNSSVLSTLHVSKQMQDGEAQGDLHIVPRPLAHPKHAQRFIPLSRLNDVMCRFTYVVIPRRACGVPRADEVPCRNVFQRLGNAGPIGKHFQSVIPEIHVGVCFLHTRAVAAA